MTGVCRLTLCFASCCLVSLAGGQSVFVSRMWHNHQPTYWPEWNTNGSQGNRVEYAWDSIVTKPNRTYSGSPAQHPENNLNDIFGNDDRRSAYQPGPRNALANLNSSAGFCMSYSGSLIDGVRSLGGVNQLGYGAGWYNGNREARNWLTPSGSRRLDLVGFTYHHSLAPLLPKQVLRKEIQIMKQAWWKAWGGNAALSDHSKGFFPTEMAFSNSMIDVLAEEGYQWSIVASHHLSRTCPTYLSQGNAADNQGIFSSLPNRADLLGPSPTVGWWYGQPNPGNAAWNVSPFAYQLHRAKYVNPATGVESSVLLVPSDDVLSYRFGYAQEGIDKIKTNIAPFATSGKPVIVMPSTDGDNAWGGGSSSWFEATPAFFSAAGSEGYGQSAIQDYVNQQAANAETVHIEDGAWIFPESCYGSANFLKWIEPPLAATAATRYANTMVDLETPGFALKFWSWAPIITGANWCETAEQILRDEGGDIQSWKIQAPYDWNGTYTNPNDVELAWHIYLHGLDSGFNYYGGLGNDDEIKSALATRRAIEKLQPFMTTERRGNDRTAPTVMKPQRFPYNPGSWNFGWFNQNPPTDNSYRKLMPSEFYVWTHAYDISGITSVNLKVREDVDGVNSMAGNQNETYAGGSEVGSWISIPMAKRVLPNTEAALNAAANNGQIDYFITPPELADYYFAKVSEANLAGLRDKLVDYHIEATDSLGNVSRSDIQHVFVENDGGFTQPVVPAVPSNLTATAANFSTISLNWTLVPGATQYRIYRAGALLGTSNTANWLDLGLNPSSTYSYSVSAWNSAGESSQSTAAQATTPGNGGSVLAPFVMDGIADSAGYRISNPGMTIYAALRGTRLYVATWAPGVSANDHFILVGSSALAAPTTAAPWAKFGFTALPGTSPFLAAESSNSYIGWFNTNGATTTTARTTGQQMEGTIDIATAFSLSPTDLYLTSLAYQTGDAGLLGSQAPAGNSNGNVEPAELLRIPIEALRDDDANGTFDRLESGKGFTITRSERTGNIFSLTWKCFPGRTYRIQSCVDLLESTWVDVSGGNVTAGPTDLEANHELPVDPAESRRFYRVVLGP